MKRIVVVVLLLISTLAFAGEASHVYDYSKDRVWPTAVRFLRVDRKLKILEKDEAAGYVLFELAQDGKVFQGSLELVRVERDGAEVTRAEMKIESRPSYVADSLLEKLEEKLKKELGAGAPRAAEPAPAE